MESRPHFAFFENTLPEEPWNRDGTKLEKLEQSWEKIAIWRRRARAFAPPVAASSYLGPKAPRESRNFVANARNFLHLCSKAPQAQCGKEPYGVFIKSRGSISVAHMGPGPNLMRYFPCVFLLPAAIYRANRQFDIRSLLAAYLLALLAAAILPDDDCSGLTQMPEG